MDPQEVILLLALSSVLMVVLLAIIYEFWKQGYFSKLLTIFGSCCSVGLARSGDVMEFIGDVVLRSLSRIGDAAGFVKTEVVSILTRTRDLLFTRTTISSQTADTSDTP